LALETDQLERALVRLRKHRDAEGAIEELNIYLTHFRGGALAREAEMARVEAFLSLGRREQALAVLDTLSLGEYGREVELRIIRAELRAEKDCRSAITDFDQVLQASAPAPAFIERALHGRASCRLRLGDQEGAKRDLEDYLRRYPGGQFAEEVRNRLGGQP
jgi:hypothetical protein